MATEHPSAYETVDVPAASAAIAAHRFVIMASGGVTQASANAVPLGVSREASPANDTSAIRCSSISTTSIVKVEAGGAIAIGDVVQVGADGKAVERSSSNPIVGQAISATSADGQFVRVWLR